MQIKAMPASTTLFKTKWNTFVTKLTPIHSSNDAQQPRNQLRRDSDDTIISRIKNRKHSDAMSVGTFESTVSMKDKFRQAIPFFRRRSSSNISTCNDEVVSHSTTSAPSVDYCHELEKLQALYTLAIDELNYAEDSQGSSYYSGDRVAAREAINNCANAYIELLRHTADALTREGLQSSMTPKLIKLQKRIDALPEVDEDGDYY
ncbi:hypothetical protein V8B55DRAFT_1391816 [Mucor lusitanicus]|uniref:Uncharacterized protein n=2 Tax=Mucor circinelloides f. lusitanicus TaxID=29924 RepID=A0A8H4BBP7_MUCCL|nr:hypothetical protein FB192DRAFT_1386100 [Mucor lusitanicus]